MLCCVSKFGLPYLQHQWHPDQAVPHVLARSLSGVSTSCPARHGLRVSAQSLEFAAAGSRSVWPQTAPGPSRACHAGGICLDLGSLICHLPILSCSSVPLKPQDPTPERTSRRVAHRVQVVGRGTGLARVCCQVVCKVSEDSGLLQEPFCPKLRCKGSILSVFLGRDGAKCLGAGRLHSICIGHWTPFQA